MSMIRDLLAITKPLNATVLVVESWIWNRPVMVQVVNECRKGTYDRVVCVGSLMSNHAESSADLAAARLVELGLDKQLVVALPRANVERHRTFALAMAVRDWLRRDNLDVNAVNVFTMGVHARKSQVIFQKVLGPFVDVGIIAGSEVGCPLERWWTSSAGFYLILRNSLGWLYAVIWPVPDANQ